MGPSTPWPNRAEAAVRVFKATLHDLCAQIGTSPELQQVTVRELLRKKAAAVMNSMVIYGGKNACGIGFGRQPRDIVTIENSSPEQLAVPVTPLEQLAQALQKWQ
jgi:hypothetical protein